VVPNARYQADRPSGDGRRIAVEAGWSDTAQLVADQLRRHLARPDVLTAGQRIGSSNGY
jgi:3-mercaptopropionate dioxygenase